MAKSRLLANMNVSPETVRVLNQGGWDTIRVSDVLSARAPDEEILEYARRENRVVVSHDLDFSTLLALTGKTRPSVVTLRLRDADPAATAKRLLVALSEVEDALETGSAVTVEGTVTRIRQLAFQ